MTREKIPAGVPVLVVDDEANMRRILQANLEKDGFAVTTAQNGQEALELLAARPYAVVISDIRMPQVNGMELLREIKESYSDVAVIMITAFGSVESAVEALKLGAIDFITKPFDRDQLMIAVSKALGVYRTNTKEGARSSSFIGKWNTIGASAPMKAVFDLVEKTADSPSTVLITGESGTGKELIAKAIHENSSRKNGSFIAINCAAIPETLIESEFFGHEKGAFTGAITNKPGRFELAQEGTLFLDEIGEISKEMQVKLLRVLQERSIERVGGLRQIPVDFRLIAATNKNLEAEVREGRFRQDLFFRLNVVNIGLPALRDRHEDLPLLTEHFIAIFNKKLNRNIQGISPEGMAKLRSYRWPGNIRELENVLERGILLADGPILERDDLHLPDEDVNGQVRVEAENVSVYEDDGADLRPLKELVKEHTSRIERQAIIEALGKNDGNVTHAAQELKISRKSLQLKMKEYDLRES